MKNGDLKIAEATTEGVLHKKDNLKNVTKFTRKHLRRDRSLNKIAGLTPVALLKKRLPHKCSSVNPNEILKNTFFTEHLRATDSEL